MRSVVPSVERVTAQDRRVIADSSKMQPRTREPSAIGLVLKETQREGATVP